MYVSYFSRGKIAARQWVYSRVLYVHIRVQYSTHLQSLSEPKRTEHLNGQTHAFSKSLAQRQSRRGELHGTAWRGPGAVNTHAARCTEQKALEGPLASRIITAGHVVNRAPPASPSAFALPLPLISSDSSRLLSSRLTFLLGAVLEIDRRMQTFTLP